MGSSIGYMIRDFLHRSDVPFEWIDKDARRLPGVTSLNDSRRPICVFPDGVRVECPTVRQITETLGWFHDPCSSEYDLAIYGGGPAGLSAAVYGASEGLTTILVERLAVGGQAAGSSKIENYLGFPKGINGAELAERAREQALRFGAHSTLEGIVGIAAAAVTAVFPWVSRLWHWVYLIAAWALVTGRALEIVAAIRLRQYISHEWLLALSGAASLLFGILALLLPLAGAVAIALGISIYALVFCALLIIGLGLRLPLDRDAPSRRDASPAGPLVSGQIQKKKARF